MTNRRVMFLAASIVVVSLTADHVIGKNVMAQESGRSSDKTASLERVLWDADQKWLCSTGAGPYRKPFKECVEFRKKYWADQFFEISDTGQVQTKAQMIAAQSKANVAFSEPYPSDFKLMAVYGNFALATDHTHLKIRDSTGRVVGTAETRVLRMFVKEDGNWKPAGAALVPIVSH